ncbi:MAG: hypothetical protein ISS25_02505 [Nanoarchaeota archaeon]|nr:hypothetical protein [DPANN group archaeon]MBL7116676.1 hypothetical protein [Nanoarchaeota archaeon]
MKIVWLSANKLGYEMLKESTKIKGVNIDSIITLSRDSKTVMYDGLDNKKWYEFGIKVFEVERINNEKELLKKLSPDIVVMCGWRQIIDKEMLGIPKMFVGFHPTLLPVGRGPAPIINSILYGFKKSGLTMFHLTEGLDDGPIIGQEKFDIAETDYAVDVYEKVINVGRKLIRKYLPLLVQGKAPMISQDDSKATVFQKPSLKDNEINLEKESAEQIYRKIKALSKPYKGAYIRLGEEKLIIWRAELKKGKSVS